MLTWIVVTSTCAHCTTIDIDACRPLAEACRDRQIFMPARPCPTPRLALGFGAGWRTAQRTARAAILHWLRGTERWPLLGRAVPRPEGPFVRTAQRGPFPAEMGIVATPLDLVLPDEPRAAIVVSPCERIHRCFYICTYLDIEYNLNVYMYTGWPASLGLLSPLNTRYASPYGSLFRSEWRPFGRSG